MRILALDTTTRAGSTAVVEDGRVVAEYSGDPARSHAERLPSDVLQMLRSASLAPRDIDVFAVASGPGSFTGLRIGIATIQGLAFVTGRPVVPVSALDALAHTAAAGLPHRALVGAWIDAHRRDVFSALYRVSGEASYRPEDLDELEEAAVAPPDVVWNRWRAHFGVPAAIAGDGAIAFAALIEGAARIVPPGALAPAIGRLAVAIARRGGAVDPAAVHPLYVRRPDAVLAKEAQRAPR
jgi:tRNA threonylcarbamoyladenosine biosynthesis protein TsaB